MPPLRVLIVADDPLVRSGLAWLLREAPENMGQAPGSIEEERGLSVVGAVTPLELGSRPNIASQQTDSPAFLDVYQPEILLWDLGPDPRSAKAAYLELVAALQTGVDNASLILALPVVFLLPGTVQILPDQAIPGGSVQGNLPQQGWGMPQKAWGIPQKAWGMLRRESAADAIYQALQAVMHGLVAIDPTLIAPGGESGPGARLVELEDLAPVERLTPRELQVLKLVAEGLSNKQAAVNLGIRETTVKYHLNTILGKLHAASRTEAVTRAARAGWLAL